MTLGLKPLKVLLSYGERSNDDFFLHYGFVPPRNPQDEVVLFPNLATAIDWYCKKFSIEVRETFVPQSDSFNYGYLGIDV